MSDKRFAMLATDALHSRKIDQLSIVAEAVYYRLHMATDKFGTMPGSVDDVMSRAFSRRRHVTDDIVAAALDELETTGLVERWVEDGAEWLYLTRFDDHTTAEYRRKRKRYLPVPPSQREGSVPTPFRPCSDPVPAPFPESTRASHSDPVPTRVEVRGESHLTGAAPTTPIPTGPDLLLEVERQHRELARDERYVPNDQRTGSARREPAETSTSVSSEPLHASEGAAVEPAAAGGSEQSCTSADALAAGLEELFTTTPRQSATPTARRYDPFAEAADAGAA